MSKGKAAQIMPGGTEFIYAYPGIGEIEHLEFTNNRETAIHLMEDGFIPCLIPQMFCMETGVYGLYLQKDRKPQSKDEAERVLSSCEQSIRDANKRAFNQHDTRQGQQLQIRDSR